MSNVMNRKWDIRFIELAKHIAQWSKDPSTKVGAVIVRPDKTIAALGYNGFPRGIADDDRLNDRPVKYTLCIHAEMNAFANSSENLKGYTIYVHPFMPCSVCALHIIQHGIVRVVAPFTPEVLRNRWDGSFNIASDVFKEAGVELELTHDK